MKNVVSNAAPGLTPEKNLVSGTKHTVVQCPKCQTKFAVDSKLIAGLDSPKFHCSRCDHVFSSSEFNQSYLPFKELRSSVQSTMPQSDSLELNQTLRQQRTKLPSKGLEIPRSLTPELKNINRAPHENEPADEKYDEQVTFDFFEDQPFEPEQSFKDSEITFHDFPKSSIESALQKDLPDKPYAHLKKRRKPGRTLMQLFAGDSHWPTLLAMIIPLGMFLLILTAASIYISLNADSSAKLTKFIPPGPVAAPAGLFIKSTNIEQVTLDSGEKVQIIKGTLVNDSKHTFRDIIIEGLFFNNLGQEIKSVRINISNSLAEARIKALSAQMINELQSNQMNRYFELTPASKSHFILALTNDLNSQASFYSVRIHSVKY